MAFYEQRNPDLPLNPAGDTMLATSGQVMNVGQLTDKGYDFVRGAAAAFTAVLEGSVTGLQWTTIANLNASAQGVVPAQYNHVRVNCTVQGALDGSVLKIAGKVL